MSKEGEVSVAEELRVLRRARVRKELAELEYRRQLVVAVSGTSQRQVAAELGLSQPSVSSALRTARRVPVPREGQQSASSPLNNLDKGWREAVQMSMAQHLRLLARDGEEVSEQHLRQVRDPGG